MGKALPSCKGTIGYKTAIARHGLDFEYLVWVCDHPVPSNGRDYDAHWRFVTKGGTRLRVTWPSHLSFAARKELEETERGVED